MSPLAYRILGVLEKNRHPTARQITEKLNLTGSEPTTVEAVRRALRTEIVGKGLARKLPIAYTLSGAKVKL